MRLGFVVVEHRSVPWKKQIWMPFLKIVEHLGAEIFVMKNVPRLLGSAEHDQINEVAHALGFKMAFTKLCTADYGVPQTRWCAFIIGCKFIDLSMLFPPRLIANQHP